MVRAAICAVLMGVVFLAGCDNPPSKSKAGEAKAKNAPVEQKSAADPAKAAPAADKAAAGGAVADPFAPVEKVSKPAGPPVSLDGPVLPGLEPAAAPAGAPPAIKPIGKSDK